MKTNAMPTFRSLAFLTILLSASFPTLAKDHLLGPTGIMTQAKGNEFLVQGIDPGSPAEEKLKKGDTIIGAAGKPFSKNARQEFAGAIDQAEASKGNLPLTLKGGQKISLQLQSLGSYSKTAPWNCQKTDAIITRIADQMVESKYARPRNMSA